MNGVESKYHNPIFMIRESCIDLVLVSSGLVKVIDGCKLINFNKIISTNHRGFIIDIDLDEYFNM